VKLYGLGKETFRFLRVCRMVGCNGCDGPHVSSRGEKREGTPWEALSCFLAFEFEPSFGVMSSTFALWDVSRRSRKLKELAGS
jgi:hypothetical protein